MGNPIICYTHIRGRQLDDVAELVSVHINYLSTGAEKSVPKLVDISEIVIEHANDSTLPPEIFDQFRELEGINPNLASMFRMKLLHQQVLARMLSEVYAVLRYRIRVEPDQYYAKQGGVIPFAIDDIRGNYDACTQTTKKFYGDQYHMENRTKKIFEQVVAQPLNDIALSQTRMSSDMQEGFKRLEDLIKTAGQNNGPKASAT